MTLLKMVAFSKEHQKKNFKPLDNESTQTEDLAWPKIFNELNINGMPKKILRQASVQKSNRKLLISLPEKMFSILNDNQKKDIEICFNDFFREELKFSYDTKVDSSLTPENEDQIKDKGLKKNIKNSIEKDSSYKEIVGGLKIEKVNFNKKNET
jgi:predicted nucleotidyltransferase